MKLMKLPLSLIVILSLVTLASGQELPDSPGRQYEKVDKILLTSLIALNTVDAATTMHNIQFTGGREQNPLARPFVTHGSGLAVGYFAGASLLDAYLTTRLIRGGHRKWARVMMVGLIVAEGYSIMPKRERFNEHNGPGVKGGPVIGGVL